MSGRSLTRLAHLMRHRSLLAAAGVLVLVAVVWAITLAAPRPPETLDQRVTDVASQLQCLVCQGESVADSPSLFAQDVRGTIRARLSQGQSEQQVMDYLVNIYGDRIRAVPPKSGFTLLIWLGPLVMLLAGIAIVAAVARQWSAGTARIQLAGEEELPELDGVSAEELERYRALLAAELGEGPNPPAPFPRREGGDGERAAVRAYAGEPGVEDAGPIGAGTDGAGVGGGAAADAITSPSSSSRRGGREVEDADGAVPRDEPEAGAREGAVPRGGQGASLRTEVR